MEKAVNSACVVAKAPIGHWVASVVKWLHRSRHKARYNRSLYLLSERQLRDIGVDPRQIVRSDDMEIERLGLLDIGWQQPRRPTRK